MWVGQLMRGMIGEPQPDQARALELRVGQIVRGVVLQLLDGKDALVSLNGVQVRARLETPLGPGQSAMLQVLPESTSGTIVLRQADSVSAQPSEAALRELMRLLGLPEGKRWAAELALDFRRGGYPVTRETGEAMRQAAAARPADVPEAEWMQAAATAWKRGLPVTEATVAALRQAMFGKPADELLESLRGQLAALAGQNGSGSGEGGRAAGNAAGGSLPAAAARALALLAEGEALLAGPANRPGAQTGPAGASLSAQPQSGGEQAGANASASTQTGMARQAGMPSGQAGQPGPAAQAGGGSGGAVPGTGAVGQSAADEAAPAAGYGRQAPAQATHAPRHETAAGARAGAEAAGTRQAAAPQGGNWIHGLLKWLGVDYEKQLAQLAGSRGGAAGAEQPAVRTAAGGDAAAGTAQGGTNAQSQPAGAQTAQAGRSAAPVQPQPAGAQVAQAGRGAAPVQPQPAEAQIARAGQGAASAQPQPAEAQAAQAGRGAAPVQPQPAEAQAAQAGRGAAPSQPHPVEAQIARVGQGAAPAQPQPAEAQAAQAFRGAPPTQPQFAEAQPTQTGGAGFAAGETLKQALMALAASEDAPAALRETAQQLVQHITGQQLLIAPEKNGALFSHLTLFIPFQGEDGGTTARITIQSRRGRKGELDPDNCRLLFDLRMRHIGDTVVDVQVVDRFVSLNIWNDHPALSRLLESTRDEAAAALESAGYQLTSMRVKPFPDTEARNAAKKPAPDRSAPPPDPAVYAGKPYKGVDYRA